MPAWLIKVRVFLAKLTDLLLMGRSIGAWNKKPDGLESDKVTRDNFPR